MKVANADELDFELLDSTRLNQNPVFRQHVRLRGEPRHDVALYRLHVDVGVIVDYRPLRIDTEQRRSVHYEA